MSAAGPRLAREPELAVAVAGIGLLGPGFDDWTSGAALLADASRWRRRPTLVPAPARLAPTERRRAGAVVRASVAVADQACSMAGIDAAEPATVFASSTGDAQNCHHLCESLAMPERAVSPTRFTNSVHNAAAGYWHIATRSMQPSSSVAAHDATAAAALLEAAVQCVCTARPTLLVVCDQPFPEPLHALRPIADVFAFALLLLPAATAGMPKLTLRVVGVTPATTCGAEALEALRTGVPAARALPLLQDLARGSDGSFVLELGDAAALRVDVSR